MRANAGKIIMDAYELLRLWVGQWMQQRGIHYAEDRCGRANAQRNRQDGNGRKPGRLAQHAYRVANVPPEIVPPEPAGRFDETLLGARDIAELAAGPGTSFFFTQALPSQTLRLQLQMGCNLPAETSALPLLPEHVPKISGTRFILP